MSFPVEVDCPVCGGVTRIEYDSPMHGSCSACRNPGVRLNTLEAAVDMLTRERDEARAEVERLRAPHAAAIHRHVVEQTLRAEKAEAEVERLREENLDLKQRIDTGVCSWDDHAEVERLRGALDQIDRETRCASDVTVIRLGSIAREAKRKAGVE
jgi:hypothetical protein